MELQELMDAANGSDLQAFGEAVQNHVQERVVTATAELAKDKTAAEAAVVKMEAKRDQFMDEVKPVQKLMRDRNIADAEALTDILDGKTQAGQADPEEITQLRTEVETFKNQAETATGAAEIAVKAREVAEEVAKVAATTADDRYFDLLLTKTTSGKDADGNLRPQPIGVLYGPLKQHLRQFIEFRDVDINGKKVRQPTAIFNGTPIIGPSGNPASVDDLVDMGLAGKEDPARPWTKSLRDFFRSNGTGGNAQGRSGQTNAGAGRVTPEMLGAAKSVAEFEALRKEMG